MRVAIIQPYIPRYRVGFFETLRELASQEGHQVEVFGGQSSKVKHSRMDEAAPDFWTELPKKRIRVFGREFGFKDLRALKAQGPWDVIVCEQAVRHLETYVLLLRQHSRHIAFWGHGRTYTKTISKAQARIKKWLTKRGDWLFVYTDGGAQHLVDQGFPRDRITVLRNSSDTKQLQNDLDSLGGFEIQEFKNQHGLTQKTALFVGGIDRPKKIDFLLAVADHARSLDPEFRIILAGRGEEETKVEQFCHSREWAAFLGRVDGHSKALALASSQILVIPGRLGLVIVDGFVAGIPTMTTNDPFHPPEYEYLVHGVNGLVSSDHPADFAEELIEVLSSSERLRVLQQQARLSAREFSAEAMARNFLNGLQSLEES